MYHETDIPKSMSSFLCFQKVSLHVNVCNMTFQEAVPLGNVIRSKLEKKLDSSLAGVTDQFQRFKRIMKENK